MKEMSLNPLTCSRPQVNWIMLYWIKYDGLNSRLNPRCRSRLYRIIDIDFYRLNSIKLARLLIELCCVCINLKILIDWIMVYYLNHVLFNKIQYDGLNSIDCIIIDASLPIGYIYTYTIYIYIVYIVFYRTRHIILNSTE